jgi:hypothetical protein
MRFREDPHKNESLKARHISELEALIARREDELAAERKASCADILKNTETHRKAFLDMLGWPLNADLPAPLPMQRSLKNWEMRENIHSFVCGSRCWRDCGSQVCTTV